MISFPEGGPARAAAVLRDPLQDQYARHLDYLRFAITDRCNLRCRYCMPADGIESVSHDDIITFEEALRLCALFCRLGVRKIRLTGGEPLVRKGAVDFIGQLATLDPAPEVLLTTNGVQLPHHLDALRDAGVRRINLSLDSLDPDTWSAITRRPGFAVAYGCIEQILDRGMGLKINMVVLAGVNDHELADFVDLTRDLPVTVRFIEAMPFDGGAGFSRKHPNGREIVARLREKHDLEAEPMAPGDVAQLYRAPGHVGRVGVIEGHTRSFCGTCTRLRLDARGRLRTCLYGAPVLDLGELIRAGAGDDELETALRRAVGARFADGRAAEQAATGTGHSSMASIGG